jgi:hypothetical protein
VVQLATYNAKIAKNIAKNENTAKRSPSPRLMLDPDYPDASEALD